MQNSTKKRTNNKFTYEEDRMLRKLVKDYGESAWEEIATQMHGRNPRQCHDRWAYYLSPKINHAPWTDEEDKRLIKAYNELNGKWVQIAKRFKGRNDVQIKNRWNTLKKIMELPKIKKPKAHNITYQKIINEQSSNDQIPVVKKDDENPTLATGVFDKFMSLFTEPEMKSNEWSSLDFFV